MTDNKRKPYFDIIRIIATISVIVLHVSGENWRLTDGRGYNWQIFNAYDALVRYAVPLFIMLSGVLMGTPDRVVDTKRLWRKNILRLAVAYIVWHMFYIFTNHDYLAQIRKLFPKDIKGTMEIVVHSEFHLWYMFMIMGIYMLIPLLRRIASSEIALKYALLLFLCISFIIPTIIQFPFLREYPVLDVLLKSIENNFYRIVSRNLHYEYIAYFLAGYYLSVVKISDSLLRRYGLGFTLVGYLGTVGISAAYAWHIGKPYNFYGHNTLNVLAESVGVFMFIRGVAENHHFKKKTVKILAEISKYCFGVYLFHICVLNMLTDIGFTTESFDPLLAVPVKSVIIFVVSLGVSAILNHIPIIKKYAV